MSSLGSALTPKVLFFAVDCFPTRPPVEAVSHSVAQVGLELILLLHPHNCWTTAMHSKRPLSQPSYYRDSFLKKIVLCTSVLPTFMYMHYEQALCLCRPGKASVPLNLEL